MLFAVSVSAPAQSPGRVHRIGYLNLGASSTPGPNLKAFQQGLHELGYVEGENLRIEYRYAEGNVEMLSKLAADLVNLKVAVIVATSTQAIEAARRATKTVPIVFPITFDPVASGFVTSLARPGGNLTGLTTLNQDMAGKRVELLKETISRISRVAVLSNPTNSGSLFALKQTEAAAHHLGIRTQTLETQGADELAGAFRSAVKEQAGALIVIPDNLFNTRSERIADLAKKSRLPLMSGDSRSVNARRPDVLWRKPFRFVPAYCDLRRQDPQGR
jgi:putative ABC transport system substrate-binding protein